MSPQEPPCVLVAVDFDKASQRAVEQAVTLARAMVLPLRILHVVPPTSFPEGTRLLPTEAEEPLDLSEYVDPSARRKLAEMIVGPLCQGLHVAEEVRCGHPAKSILIAAEEHRAAFLVLGTHGRTGLDRALMGSVAEQVIRNTTVPVLVVRTPDEVAAGIPQDHAFAGATVLSGAVAGATLGALAGPPGAIAGGALGSIAGAVAGRVIEAENARASRHDRELDAAIGVTAGSIGAPAEAKRPSPPGAR